MTNTRPTLLDLERANPEFFSPEWMEVYKEARYTILPNPNGGFMLIVDHKYSRPRYVIGDNNVMIFDGHEDD